MCCVGHLTKAYSYRMPTTGKSRQDRTVRLEDLFYQSRWIKSVVGSYSINTQWNVSRREMSYLGRITFNPEQCGGRPCIRGMRIRVKDVLDLLAAGVSAGTVIQIYSKREYKTTSTKRITNI